MENMSVQTKTITIRNQTATGTVVEMQPANLITINTPHGMIGCGFINPSAGDKFDMPIAIAGGTPEKPLATIDDLLNAKIKAVSQKAEKIGIQIGMTGKQALEVLITQQ